MLKRIITVLLAGLVASISAPSSVTDNVEALYDDSQVAPMEIPEDIDVSKLEHEEPMNSDTIEKEPIEEYFWMDLGSFEITAYCPCTYCCGPNASGITCTGTQATAGRTIGVDPNYIPLGSKVKIVFSDGSEHEYIAEDTGGAIKGNIIDLFCNSHQEALNFGRQIAHVYIEEVNDSRN